MTAILCPRCHKLVSPDSDVCIHCGLRKPGLWGITSAIRKLGLSLDIPTALSAVCIVLYVMGLLLDPSALLNFNSILRLFSPSMESSFKLGMTGSQPIFRYDLWWTPITAIYLHGGLLHIFFNIGWIRQLGPIIDRSFGPFRFFIIFTISGIIGFLVSALMGNAFTLGASGSIFGLLAAAIVFGRHTGQGLFTRQLLQWAGLMFIMGFVFPGVDNWAHGGGFVGGYVTAQILARSIGSREGIVTYLGAGICMLSTIGAFLLQLFAVWGLI